MFPLRFVTNNLFPSRALDSLPCMHRDACGIPCTRIRTSWLPGYRRGTALASLVHGSESSFRLAVSTFAVRYNRPERHSDEASVAGVDGLLAVWTPIADSGVATDEPTLNEADTARQKHKQNQQKQQLCLRYATSPRKISSPRSPTRLRRPKKCQKRPIIGAKETYYVRTFASLPAARTAA
jgi:hypothetical protein